MEHHLRSHLAKRLDAFACHSHGLILLLICSLLSIFCSAAVAGSIGINYGRVANNLPSPRQAVQLMQSCSLRKVKLYDADARVLRALAYTQMEVIIGFPNEQVYSIARKPSLARKWIKRNVAKHIRATNITAISVGNEVLTSTRGITKLLLPAMRNLHDALVALNLESQVKLSTPHALNVLSNSFPPSAGAFRPDIATSVMKPLLDFLSQTGSFVMINAYPYFAYRANPAVISLDYTLFRPNAGVKDPQTGLVYTNLLDAQLDAVFAAMASLGHKDLRIVVTETGWPSKGDPTETGVSVSNAAAYNGNLINHITTSNGTPMKPGVPVDVFIFALFNEDLKPGPESERNYGLFYPDQSMVYDVGMQKTKSPAIGNKPQLQQSSWCVAKPGVSKSSLQAALDYACGLGKADCSRIQVGQTCFDPNTLVDHASYAFNSYYQKNQKQTGTCDFGGTAMVVQQDPSEYTKCAYPQN
ncbi:hypothetical protein O6H91_01G109100 [Diphasiastrum complanatum]|uniref:Uncharacterized protein n=1 Tax=Diphasiastrum complanatum TaxID=34168 RepID=A0ACC2EUT0_DIPCM|nr:hypothetical protein O6H91_01G109100 [Diphasiastrum complanatum]